MSQARGGKHNMDVRAWPDTFHMMPLYLQTSTIAPIWSVTMMLGATDEDSPTQLSELNYTCLATQACIQCPCHEITVTSPHQVKP